MTYIIAEVGINHNGNEGLAKKLIAKAHQAGANAVKFQKRDISIVYTEEELNLYRESPWGTTNRQQKEGLEFSIEQYQSIKKYCDQLEMDFIMSCWDINSIYDVECLDIKYHKIASALATDKEFLETINKTGKPVILSTGMCTENEIDAAVTILDNVQYILCCTSTYPELNLRHITVLQQKYPHLKIGFSNHYNGHDACVVATALGAECLEFHITYDRAAYGSDQAASIENATDLISAVRQIEIMLGDGIKKVYDTEIPIAKKLRKISNTYISSLND